jgi:hypothetical protein
MTRKVLTPWRGDDPESFDESDIEMPDADLIRESEGNDADRRERRTTERLARYYAACYVETPGYETRLALRMLTSWFDERTAELVAGECIWAGIIMSASEAGIPTALRGSIPRRSGTYMDLESANPCRHPRRRRPLWTYTTNVLPKDARRWYAMVATNSMYSLPIAVTHAGANMRKMAGLTDQGGRTPRCGRMIRPTPSGDEDA